MGPFYINVFNCVSGLNPNYHLPSRHTMSKTLVPKKYEQTLIKCKLIIFKAHRVCLTTDCWTSRNNESFMAVTAHFITDDFFSKSMLLSCTSFSESHTSVNIAQELKNIMDEWNINQKVGLIVSDNASNVVGAVQKELKLKHLGCTAHNINLILSEALGELSRRRVSRKI